MVRPAAEIGHSLVVPVCVHYTLMGAAHSTGHHCSCLSATIYHCLMAPHRVLSAPPTSLDEWFFFKSLVVRLPHSSISWQFWLFFVFRLVVILLMVGGRGEASLVRLHLRQRFSISFSNTGFNDSIIIHQMDLPQCI